MSFNELIKANFVPKEKEIIIKINKDSPEERELKFKAVEISATRKIVIHGARMSNEDHVSELIAASIIDPEGKKMTLQQAQSLPEEYAAVFFVAASEVNFDKSSEIEVSEKN